MERIFFPTRGKGRGRGGGRGRGKESKEGNRDDESQFHASEKWGPPKRATPKKPYLQGQIGRNF